MKLRIACRYVLLMADEIPAVASHHRKKNHTLNMMTRREKFLFDNGGNSLAEGPPVLGGGSRGIPLAHQMIVGTLPAADCITVLEARTYLSARHA